MAKVALSGRGPILYLRAEMGLHLCVFRAGFAKVGLFFCDVPLHRFVSCGHIRRIRRRGVSVLGAMSLRITLQTCFCVVAPRSSDRLPLG